LNPSAEICIHSSHYKEFDQGEQWNCLFCDQT